MTQAVKAQMVRTKGLSKKAICCRPVERRRRGDGDGRSIRREPSPSRIAVLGGEPHGDSVNRLDPASRGNSDHGLTDTQQTGHGWVTSMHWEGSAVIKEALS